MFFRRLDLQIDLAAEFRLIHLAGDGLADVLNGFRMIAPSERDRFDLVLLPGLSVNLDDAKLGHSVFTSRIIQEDVVFMSGNNESGAKRPRVIHEFLGEFLFRCHGTHNPSSLVMHHHRGTFSSCEPARLPPDRGRSRGLWLSCEA